MGSPRPHRVTFPTTHWSLLLRSNQRGSAEGRRALDELLSRYLPALRAHLVAARRMSPDEADDALQAFVVAKVLERNLVADADRAKGKFRTLLLTIFDRFVISEFRRRALARMGMPAIGGRMATGRFRETAMMGECTTDVGGCGNPLLSNSPGVWDELIEAVGPASLLVVIEGRLSKALLRQTTPEDVLQESLMQAWRDRRQCEWRGVRSFRAWLLCIIDNRIRDAADRSVAAKRGGGRPASVVSTLERGDESGSAWGPVGSTTPSRIAVFREQAAAIHAALSRLPDEVRDVVRLRLFEQAKIEEIAATLAIGGAAVRHRFRKGAELYHRYLREALATSVTHRARTAPPAGTESSPIP